MSTPLVLPPLRIEPELRERVWGGSRYPAAALPIGEAWLAFGESRVLDGSWAGATLESLSAQLGSALLGTAGTARYAGRFPLLVKILDTADWLSVQVHPDDAQAVTLEGSGPGKSEAWHVLAAAPGASVLAGTREGVAQAEVVAAIGSRALVELLQRAPVQVGDSVLVPPGLLHSLGVGLTVYEIQQPSDITYRCYDWDRGGRELHLDKSRAVVDATRPAIVRHASDRPREVVIETPDFRVERMLVGPSPTDITTGGTSCHILTVTDGSCQVTSAAGTLTVSGEHSVVVPASLIRYSLRSTTAATVLVASVPSRSRDDRDALPT